MEASIGRKMSDTIVCEAVIPEAEQGAMCDDCGKYRAVYVAGGRNVCMLCAPRENTIDVMALPWVDAP